MRTSLLWLLVAILVASIGGGGAFVLLGLGHELSAAQQRTTFVANVSHELKTPLTSIRMFAEMLRDGRQADPARRQRYLDLMVAESGRLARLVNNVLDFSQLEQGRKRYARRETDLVELCRGVLEAERPRLELAGFTVTFQAAGIRPRSPPTRTPCGRCSATCCRTPRSTRRTGGTSAWRRAPRRAVRSSGCSTGASASRPSTPCGSSASSTGSTIRSPPG